MKTGKIQIIAIAVLTVLVVYCILRLELNKPKIGYVRSAELITKSKAYQKLTTILEQQDQAWKSNVDTLRAEYLTNLNSFNQDYKLLSNDERNRRGELLARQETTIKNYEQAVIGRAKEEREQMSDSLLKNINASVEQFGRENNYQVILGTTADGSILYGADAADVTKEVLEMINR